jgi:putative molybdopterin biosynthesis protein
MQSLEQISKFNQLKAVSDPRNLSILNQLMDASATLTQLGNALGKHPAWTQPPLKLLEQAGLVELSTLKISDGYIEKYYQSIALAYLLQELLLPDNPGKQTIFVSGSHDLALEIHALISVGDLYVITNPVGSLDGLVALRQGLCLAAGCHLYDKPSGDYNSPYVRHLFPDKRMTLLTLAHRQQGLIVSLGNPLKIQGLQDLARQDIRFINRNPGSGTRLWLDARLVELGILPGQISGYSDEATTHTAVAVAIQAGQAQVGLGIRAAASSFQLGFIPLFDERYNIVIPHELLTQEKLSPMFDAFYSGDFRHQVEHLGGYDVSHLGDQIIL